MGFAAVLPCVIALMAPMPSFTLRVNPHYVWRKQSGQEKLDTQHGHGALLPEYNERTAVFEEQLVHDPTEGEPTAKTVRVRASKRQPPDPYRTVEHEMSDAQKQEAGLLHSLEPVQDGECDHAFLDGCDCDCQRQKREAVAAQEEEDRRLGELAAQQAAEATSEETRQATAEAAQADYEESIRAHEQADAADMARADADNARGEMQQQEMMNNMGQTGMGADIMNAATAMAAPLDADGGTPSLETQAITEAQDVEGAMAEAHAIEAEAMAQLEADPFQDMVDAGYDEETIPETGVSAAAVTSGLLAGFHDGLPMSPMDGMETLNPHYTNMPNSEGNAQDGSPYPAP